MSRTLVAPGTVVQVGQRIHSILYGGRDGIVYRIHGDQSPGSCRHLPIGASMGGRAEFDIVFDNGTISRQLPETILRGVQWRIYDSIATGDEIAKALSFAEHDEARRDTEKRLASERRAAERKSHAISNPHLLKKEDRPRWSPGRLAAENIRRELKRVFPGFKFSVTSDFDSVRVGWIDGPTSEAVEAITNKYTAGDFNGMDDCYHYDEDATFADVFGDPRYVFATRGETVEGLRSAWAAEGRDPAEVSDGWKDGACWNLPEGLMRAIRDAWSKADLR